MLHLQSLLKKYAAMDDLSDVHIHADSKVAVRINGDILVSESVGVSASDLEQFARAHLSRQLLERWRRDKSLDVTLDLGGQRFRANFYFAADKQAVALRKIARTPPSLELLNLPPVVRDMLSKKSGLTLVVGATGSGKSTSLAAMASHILTERAVHLISIEDPIEFRLQSTQSLVSQRQIGNDVETFAAALRDALREDPDVIVIGEMRDAETISLALSAAELGHLVMATLHAPNSVLAVARIINAFPAQFREHIATQLADSLNLIVAQALFKKASGGRRAAYEALTANDAVRNLIRERKIFNLTSVLETSRSQGMISMADSIAELRDKGELVK